MLSGTSVEHGSQSSTWDKDAGLLIQHQYLQLAETHELPGTGPCSAPGIQQTLVLIHSALPVLEELM